MKNGGYPHELQTNQQFLMYPFICHFVLLHVVRGWGKNHLQKLCMFDHIWTTESKTLTIPKILTLSEPHIQPFLHENPFDGEVQNCTGANVNQPYMLFFHILRDVSLNDTSYAKISLYNCSNSNSPKDLSNV